jgi:polar amino acid transport system substrate-binding protein
VLFGGVKGWAIRGVWVLLGLSSPALAGELAVKPASVVRIATGEFPPYADSSRAGKGIAVSIVREAFALAGHKTQFSFLPWSRAQRDTRDALFDASSHWGASAERRRDFLLSDAILTEQWVLLHRSNDPLEWDGFADLGQRRVGVTRDYTYTAEFWAAVQSKVLVTESVHNDLAGLRMLLVGRIDVLPLERSVACWLLSRHFEPAQAALLMAASRPLSTDFQTHLILPPQLARSTVLLRDFNVGLAKLKASKVYADLLRGVSCPKGLELRSTTELRAPSKS